MKLLLFVVLSLACALEGSPTGGSECKKLACNPGSCYHMVWESVTWYQAARKCNQQYGGFLASMNTEEEWISVTNWIQENHILSLQTDEVWTGGIRLGQRSPLIWYNTAEPIPMPSGDEIWHPWASGEPNNFQDSGENCVAMDFRSVTKTTQVARQGKLNDAGCDVYMDGFICEKAVDHN